MFRVLSRITNLPQFIGIYMQKCLDDTTKFKTDRDFQRTFVVIHNIGRKSLRLRTISQRLDTGAIRTRGRYTLAGDASVFFRAVRG